VQKTIRTATVWLGREFLFDTRVINCNFKNDGLLVPFLSFCAARGSGFLITQHIMPSFQLKQFPPPALGGVPIEYIVQQLHALADNFWDKPETADCTISMSLLSSSTRVLFFSVVPFPHALGKPDLPAFSQTSLIEPAFSYAPTYELTNLGRRATQPPLNAVPRISLAVRSSVFIKHSLILSTAPYRLPCCPLELPPRPLQRRSLTRSHVLLRPTKRLLFQHPP
jgi:hypothetical protein